MTIKSYWICTKKDKVPRKKQFNVITNGVYVYTGIGLVRTAKQMLLHCLSKNKRFSLHSLSLPGISTTVILMTESWMTPVPDLPDETDSLKWIFQKNHHCSFIVSISSQWHWCSLSCFLFWSLSCEIHLYLNFKNCDQTDINFHINFFSIKIPRQIPEYLAWKSLRERAGRRGESI